MADVTSCRSEPGFQWVTWHHGSIEPAYPTFVTCPTFVTPATGRHYESVIIDDYVDYRKSLQAQVSAQGEDPERRLAKNALQAHIEEAIRVLENLALLIKGKSPTREKLLLRAADQARQVAVTLQGLVDPEEESKSERRGL